MPGRWLRGYVSRQVCCGFALALLVNAPPAHSQTAEDPAAEPFRLVWSSSAGCHDASAFLAELTGRTARLRKARADEHAITLIVETFRHDGGVRGQLTVRKPDGDLTVREVPGVSCQEVEAAMALIAALMVDPLAGQARPNRPKPEFEPSLESRPKPAAWSLRAEHRLSARTATTPNLAWGQALGAMLTYEAGAVKPSIGLLAEAAGGTATAAHGSAELELTTARLVACPLGVQPASALDLRLCATAELGRLRGSGYATDAPATKAVVWSSAGIDLQARYELMRPLWVGLEGGFTLPFTRERFYVEPDETLHRVPAWGLAFSAGLGLRFF
ncbi:MAG TPA: hypothetical protein VHP33_07445 [Polyangiaceae bacterium]|nr:hypothetical protein [Polyangiaceae bacterium]